MCRLFGMSGGPRRVTATFWLIEAPDSLSEQSRREPDGTGLGSYDEHERPRIEKQPLAAYEDQSFATEAKDVHSRTFVAHVRYASNGAVELRNTHPFEQAGRIFAHNGVIGDVPALEHELGDAMSLVQGDTDSERFFALITKTIEGGADVETAITEAAGWVAENLPVFALNFVLIEPQELWAFRYPDTHDLHLLERDPGGPSGDRHLEHKSPWRTVHVQSHDLAQAPSVVVASEEMDDDPGWRALQPGELLHVDSELKSTIKQILDRPPAHQLTLADLDPRAAASQAAQKK